MDEPITREEQYLNRIASGSGALPAAPITRQEQYLERIATGSGNLPAFPITREEMYLDYIATHPSGDVIVETLSVTENGTYTAPSGKAYSPVTVNVPTDEPVLIALNTEINGTFTPPEGVDGYDEVTVDVPAAILATLSVTENGTYTPTDSDGYYEVSVSVPQGEPISVSTAAGMAAVLTAENVGKVYRFTGTTDSDYTNGDLYVVEAN